MNPPPQSTPAVKERRRLFMSRAFLLGAIAGSLETLLVLTTGTMLPAELSLNFALLVTAFGAGAGVWLMVRRLPLLNRIPGDVVLVLLSILLFSLRGCLHNCTDDIKWRLAVPGGLAVAAVGALALLRRMPPARFRAGFVLVATAVMTVSALDFAHRDGLVGSSDIWTSVPLTMGAVAILSSLVVEMGWIAKITWAVLLGVISFSWASFRAMPLRIEPSATRTSSSAASPEPGKPNVILVVLDTVRADHLSLYGYGRRTSPNLDALAAESLVFGHAVASGNYSLSSHASLFTGLLPAQHGAHPRSGDGAMASSFRRIDSGLAKGVDTIAGKLVSLGFVTGGASANSAYLAPWTGLQQGFGTFDSRRRRLMGFHPFSFPFFRRLGAVTSLEGERQEWDAEIVTASGSHFAQTAREPFLLFLNYFDAHSPHVPQADHNFRGDGHGSDARSIPAYDSEIAHVDAALGELVEVLRETSVLDRTILVIAGDHGEFFGEHGLAEHRVGAYEDVLHVPLLVRYPAGLRAGRVPRAFGLHEVRRLILDLVEARPTDWVYGGGEEPRVLAQVWGRVSAEDVIASARVLDPDANVVYMGPFKLIDRRLGADQLFDLATDPKEERDLLVQPSPEHLGLKVRMQAAVTRLPPSREGEDPDATAADIAALRGLGYISLKKPGVK